MDENLCSLNNSKTKIKIGLIYEVEGRPLEKFTCVMLSTSSTIKMRNNSTGVIEEIYTELIKPDSGIQMLMS
jgi:hypothetical protein